MLSTDLPGNYIVRHFLKIFNDNVLDANITQLLVEQMAL
jgi:hypothetical protein